MIQHFVCIQNMFGSGHPVREVDFKRIPLLVKRYHCHNLETKTIRQTSLPTLGSPVVSRITLTDRVNAGLDKILHSWSHSRAHCTPVFVFLVWFWGPTCSLSLQGNNSAIPRGHPSCTTRQPHIVGPEWVYPPFGQFLSKVYDSLTCLQDIPII